MGVHVCVGMVCMDVWDRMGKCRVLYVFIFHNRKLPQFVSPVTVCTQANELLFGGRRITALEAYQLGLVSHVFWPTAFMQEVIPRAQNMASCSAKVILLTTLTLLP